MGLFNIGKNTVFLSIAIFFCLYGLSYGVDYSVDILMVKKTNGNNLKGKLYFKDLKVRQELSSKKGKQIFISRPDKGIAWIINTNENKIAEIQYYNSNEQFTSWTKEKAKKAKLISTEMIGNVYADKYEIINKHTGYTYFWISKDTNYPVKVEYGNTEIYYNNRNFTKLPDELFEIPDGYSNPIVMFSSKLID